jgi:hypothetical protein
MPATRREVNKQELQDVVSGLESRFFFPSVSALWRAVAASPWASRQKFPLSRPTIASMAARYAINYRTRTTTKYGQAGRITKRKPTGQTWQYRIVYQNHGEPDIKSRVIKVDNKIRVSNSQDIDNLERDHAILLISISELND